MRYLAQIACCTASAAAVMSAIALSDHREPTNWIAFLAPPILIAIAANRTGGRRSLMAMALVPYHLVAMATFGVLVIGY